MTRVEARHCRLCPPNYKAEGKTSSRVNIGQPISSQSGGALLRLASQQTLGCFNSSLGCSTASTALQALTAAENYKLQLLQHKTPLTLSQELKYPRRMRTLSSSSPHVLSWVMDDAEFCCRA